MSQSKLLIPATNNNPLESSIHEISPAQNETTSPKTTENPQTPQKQDSINPRRGKTSGWKIFKTIFFLKRGKKPEPKSLPPPAASHEQAAAAEGNTEKIPEENENLTNLILADVEYIKESGKKLGDYKEELNSLLSKAPQQRNDLVKLREENLRDLRKAILKLKLQIPTDEKHPYKKLSSFSLPQQSTIPEELLKLVPNLHENRVFENAMEFQDFVARYNNLGSPDLKLCLLCFSVFPENAIIKKRLMLQWWVAEGFADNEECAGLYFLELIEKAFIQPVNQNESPSIKSCRIHPFFRSVLVKIAGRVKFFNFDSEGNPTQDFSGSLRACLIGKVLTPNEDLDKIHIVFNVSENNLDLEPSLFSKMRNVSVLHLGRWLPLRSDHPVIFKTEDESKVFLDGLINLKYLKLLNLHGVSNIETIKGSSMEKMINLKFLDLKQCDDLKNIPSEIKCLRSLTHLDISYCGSLKEIPKELSQLTDLRVLKGFIVSASSQCTLDDLKALQHLIKLSVATHSSEFPNLQNLRALEKMGNLQKLTITWTTSNEEYYNSDNDEMMKLPLKLEKLDLRSFPTSRKSRAPKWLQPRNLKDVNLKKLYIRGGNFSDLGQYEEIDGDGWSLGNKETWKVEQLRLRFLSEMEMEWDQLRELFPNLDYLEHLDCPKLGLFPCHANECGGEAEVIDSQRISFSWKKNRSQ